MRFPGGRLLGSVLVVLVVTGGCTGPAMIPSPPSPPPWRVVAADTQGAVVSDGKSTRGFRRGRSEAVWEVAGDPNGAVCDGTCPDAYLVMDTETELVHVDASGVRRTPLGRELESLRPLGLAGASLVFVASDDGRELLLAWEDGAVRRLRDLGAGSLLWQPRDGRGTLFLYREHAVVATTLDFRGPRLRVHDWGAMPHRTMCYDESGTAATGLPASAFAALERSLTSVSACVPAPDRWWLGISTFITTGTRSDEGLPMLKVAATSADGIVAWTSTITGGDLFELSSDRRQLAVVGPAGLVFVDVATGEVLRKQDAVQDATYVGTDGLVTVIADGTPSWTGS